MKQHKKLIANLIFAAVVLAAAALMLVLRAAKTQQPAYKAQLIYGRDNEVMDIPLDEDRTYDINTGYLLVHIEVKDGAARFINSPCPDHTCEHFGWISQEDQSATCLPGRAVLTIVPAS